jgi:NADH:ubiquinone oxidoreductase subunit
VTITTRLFTSFYGKPVGGDAFGNQYYIERAPKKGSRAKRWVRYSGASFFQELIGWGLPDPSRVPPEWHGWLHYTTDLPPTNRTIKHHAWEKPHQPNLTGTTGAYLPPGHLEKGADRSPATADYEAWKP